MHRQLEARLIEERAELVASNGLLDQNERLRAVIVAEEREKFQSEKVGYSRARPRSYSCYYSFPAAAALFCTSALAAGFKLLEWPMVEGSLRDIVEGGHPVQSNV